jgi:predicted ATPase
MSKIRIKNFGPIKEGFTEGDGFMDVKKVTIFIGNQGSGKSTVAKLISTFSWIEKALTRGDYEPKEFTSYSRFRKNYCSYHRIENYFFDIKKNDLAEIEYLGNSYRIKYDKGVLTISEVKSDNYPLPQIMYVPAERNFISYVKSPKELKLSSDSLKEFLTEFDNAKDAMKGSMKLPINNVDIEYDKLNDIVNIKGKDKDGKDYKVRLTESSSGFQSLVPLYLVSDYLANGVRKATEANLGGMSSEEIDRFKILAAEIYSNESLTSEQRRAALSAISSKFNKTAFINIVEEPEQNLFPSSQRQMVNSLLEFNNMNDGNKLIMTSHSPYLLVYLTLAVEADKLKQRCNTNELKSKLNEVVPMASTIDGKELVIYQLDENMGTIEKLGNYKGLPSDENKLNDGLIEANDDFSKLLDLEDLCQ